MSKARSKYRVPNPERYRRQHTIYLERAARLRQKAADGEPLHHWNTSMWQDAALELAGSALAFDEGDDVVARHFADALAASRAWLTAGTPWRPRPQPVDPKVTVIDHGDVVFEVTERPPRMAEIGWIQDWHIGVFETTLMVFLAFGSDDDARRSAQFPEVAYRSPDVIGDITSYASVRAQKAWALRDYSGARAACLECLEAPAPKLPRVVAKAVMSGRGVENAKARALLAMMDGDSNQLSAAMQDLEGAHKQFYAHVKGTALRFYSLPGLALARMAKSHDLAVGETLTIPTRFLPIEERSA